MVGIFYAICLFIRWMLKSRYRFLSFIFILLLIIPSVTHPVLKNVLSAEIDGLIENRNLNNFELSLQDFGANFEIFYQDNFPFRNTLIPLYNKYYNIIYSKYFNDKNEYISQWDIEEPVILEWHIADDPVIDELYIAQEPVPREVPLVVPVINDIQITENETFKRFLDILIEADNYFNSHNKKIIFQVCPRKYYITSRITGATELDLLSYYISRNSTVSFSYPKNAYLAVEPGYMTYDEYNGHHNFLGAYVSWQEIQRKAGIEVINIDWADITEFEIDVRRIITTPCNITCCYPYNQDLPAVRKTEYITSINYIIPYKPDTEIETIHNSSCFWLEYKSNNTNGQTLFLTGDSFLETQIQYAIKDFEFVNISHLYNYEVGSRSQTYRDRIKKYIESSDVIVIVIGENNFRSNNLEHNPGLEHRLALILELAREIYR